jgi:hypothetical protein
MDIYENKIQKHRDDANVISGRSKSIKGFLKKAGFFSVRRLRKINRLSYALSSVTVIFLILVFLFAQYNYTHASFGFAPKVDYATGSGSTSYPMSVVIGDLNSDGNADLATANYWNAKISVFINNSDGTFATHVDYTAGTYPESIAIGDVSGDGKADLAVANYGSNRVSVFINNGDGTFAAKADYVTGTGPISVAIGDVSGDGKADLAVTNYGSTSVSVFINNGSGTFAAKVDYTTGSGPRSVAIGDLSGDGRADLATANNASNNASIFINNGSGTFAAKVDYPLGGSARSIAIGDLDGDGDADLTTANFSTPTASVLMNNGSGTFATKVDYTTGSSPTSVAVGDLDGDGDADLAVANDGTTLVSVFLNNGNGTFAAKVDYTTAASPQSVAIGDLNNDGKRDLVSANWSSDKVSVLINNSTDPPPSSAPANFIATDGTYTDKVALSWNAVSGATGYDVWNGSVWIDVGNVLTYDDTAAPAPTINQNSTSASDGTSATYVTLNSTAGTSAGSVIAYKVRAYNAGGDGPESGTENGNRGVGSLTYQWQRSAGDSDGSYSNLSGAVTSPFNDTTAPADVLGRYYKVILNASGAGQVTSSADRGFRTFLAPADLLISDETGTSMVLNWVDNSIGEDGFKVDRSTDGTNFSQTGTAPAESTSYSGTGTTGLDPNTDYWFRVRAYQGSINGEYTQDATAQTLGPISNIFKGGTRLRGGLRLK